MRTPYRELPDVSADNALGVTWILTRSDEIGTIALYQVHCPLQDAPHTMQDIEFLGRFSASDLLHWAYKGRLAESGAFESWILWDFMRALTGRGAAEMLAWRVVLGHKLEYLEPVADMDPEALAAMFPPLPRAA